MVWLITYDIADDRRREAVAALLAAWGARVQYSVFECEFPDATVAADILHRVEELIDALDDQVRVYRLPGEGAGGVQIMGRRRLEEREDFWIV
ncbi:CRISPR-associated endonuclease Cas2 [Rhabdothermincola sediminis]|uniref:CRISPR-associated endonuclease Cas2 n=1 Tax=Rhabdothermincola sediminis TaxID=2751370 RepID=UPI001AA0A9D9|nr:CRISPR-associated endonuclease Cas2 [Rhabdothermincola sediminis]